MRSHASRVRRWCVITAALALFVTTTPPSLAGDRQVVPQSSSQCSAGRLCLWAKAGYTGSLWSTASTSIVDVSAMTTTRSVWNRTAFAVRVYANPGGSGASVCYGPGVQASNVVIASGSARVLSTTAC